MRVTALFAGIGGIERGLGDGFETTLFCESEPAARAVLARRFPGVRIAPDVKTLDRLPRQTDVVTAGFPCTDLSQAGRTAGIRGPQSGLVDYVFDLLEKPAGARISWLVVENVRNMLALGHGHAMNHVVTELEALRFAWAYRVVDTRSFGLPQRRQRVLLVASPKHDPRPVLFGPDAGEPNENRYREDAFGFYWTEGLRGLGWARDATPTLKGGSSIGIPSPPAIWQSDAAHGRKFVTPSIEDAERLQGFRAKWTHVQMDDGRPLKAGQRWKMVGNAVSVPVSAWLGRQFRHPSKTLPSAAPLATGSRWPLAAWGAPKSGRYRVEASMWPEIRKYRHLSDFLDLEEAAPLSHQAAAGFLSRLDRSYLRVPEDFRLDLKRHVELTA